MLEAIPKECIELEWLTCFWCLKLTEIPQQFVKLRKMACISCPLVLSVPRRTPLNANHYYLSNCPWVPKDEKAESARLISVFVIQRWVRRSRQGRFVSMWMRTKEFNKWFYAPSGIGGRMHKRHTEKFIVGL
jgi:hypothetical protein